METNPEIKYMLSPELPLFLNLSYVILLQEINYHDISFPELSLMIAFQILMSEYL